MIYFLFKQGNAGIGFSILIILMTISVSMVAALSAIGVCERCKMERGGVYFLLSHVLGAKVGASIGILYCFGQVGNWLINVQNHNMFSRIEKLGIGSSEKEIETFLFQNNDLASYYLD